MDAVRFTLGDTVESAPLLQDEEINFALAGVNNSVTAAAVICCRAIMAHFAPIVNSAIGPLKVDAEAKYKQFKDLLVELKSGNSQLYAAPSGDVSRPASFDVGMHDA
jgi:hypothetical protein